MSLIFLLITCTVKSQTHLQTSLPNPKYLFHKSKYRILSSNLGRNYLEISSTGLQFQKRKFYIFKKSWSKWKTETPKYYSKAAVSLLGLTITSFWNLYTQETNTYFSLQDSHTLILWPLFTVRLLNLDFFSSYSMPDLMGTKNKKLDIIQFFFHNWIVFTGRC